MSHGDDICSVIQLYFVTVVLKHNSFNNFNNLTSHAPKSKSCVEISIFKNASLVLKH